MVRGAWSDRYVVLSTRHKPYARGEYRYRHVITLWQNGSGIDSTAGGGGEGLGSAMRDWGLFCSLIRAVLQNGDRTVAIILERYRSYDGDLGERMQRQ